MWHDRSAWLRIRLAGALRAVVPPRLARHYRERESFRRKVHRAASWAWVPLLVYSYLFTDSGLVSIVYRQVRIRELQHQLVGLEMQQSRLEAEADRRTDDPATIERVARERYDLAYPGETVYRIVEISPSQGRRIARAQREIEKKRAAEEGQPATGEPASPHDPLGREVATRRHR
jgi:cell division protein FtsB